ncbi:MAG: DUF4838 domain-containing protein [Bacilli bacterium]|nr:DUF4838 domain-containing protein [Bacilli bacterium]
MKKNTLFLLLLSALMVGCSGPQSGGDVIGKEDDIARYPFEGVHDFDVKETEDYIVKNNVTDYKLLLPNAVDSYLTTAKEEFVALFKKATGITIDVVNETAAGMEHDALGKYISIGDTHMFSTSGLSFDKEALGTQAVRIQTKDKTVYLNGGDTHGCIYAVYDFLEALLHFDTYSYDCVYIDEVENLKFYEMNITDIPDIQIRANSWGFIKENPNNVATRLRTPFDFADYILAVADTEAGATRSAIHNSLDIIPRNAPTSRPTWFSDSGDQICYTAHGNPEDYQALVDRSAEIIEQGLVAFDPVNYPMKNIVTFTMEDNHDICKCESCTAKTKMYGEQSGNVIYFCNDLMAKIRAWMDDPINAKYNRPDFKLLFFAYNDYVNAPAHYDPELKKNVINHPDLVMRDDVGVYYAISSGINYQLSIYDKENQEGVVNYKKWCDVAPSTYLWTYNANFGGYLSHVNSTNFYNPDAYQFFASGHAKLLYNQGGWNTYNLTAFQMLAIYLDAKLSWNSNLDMNKLIDGWFEHMFLDAANDMKKLYEAENLYSLVLLERAGKFRGGIINVAVGNQEFWPQQMLMKWLSFIDDARAKVAVYEEVDPALFKTIKEHIDLEWVSPAYFLLSLYGKDYLSAEMYYEMANYFYYEILPLKFFLVSERSAPLSTWILTLLQ